MPPKLEKSHRYYVTVSPNPRKMLGSKCYGAHRDYRQRNYIADAIDTSIRWCRLELIPDVYYEYNKRLQIHAHFEVKATEKQMSGIQRHINDRLGSARLSPEICCHICPERVWDPKINPETEEPYKTWLEYCQKDGDEPRHTLCQCMECKVSRQDKVIMDKIEHGDILLGFE